MAKNLFFFTKLIAVLSAIILAYLVFKQPYSPFDKALAWYRLKMNNYASSVEGATYVQTLLEGTSYTSEKAAAFPYLSTTEKLLSSQEQEENFITTTVEDPNFVKDSTYTFPKGKNGRYLVDSYTLFVNGRETAQYSKTDIILEQTTHQISYIGTKESDILKQELANSWKRLTTAIKSKSGAEAEGLLTFVESQLFNKTTKITDISYKLDASVTITLKIEKETETSIRVGTVSLKQKNCSILGEGPIIYVKETKNYHFDSVYAALSSLCTKPKATSGTLSCADCWLAPVSKQFALKSSYYPYVVATGVNGGGSVTPPTQKALKKLFADAKANGIGSIRVSSSFRSYTTQVNLFNSYVANEKKLGMSTAQATEKANTYSAKPGHSEHQLGTTLDLMACAYPCQFNDNANTPLYTYLKKNAYKFGFVISYPDGSRPYTGYVYEPWHIRYVGVTYATELYNRGYLSKKGFYLYQFLLEKGDY